jgi:hypothetical protein
MQSKTSRIVNIKTEYGEQSNLTLGIGESNIKYIITKRVNEGESEININSFFKLIIKARSQWVGSLCSLKLFHGISEVYNSDFYLGAETEHDFSLTGKKESFIIKYLINLDLNFTNNSNEFTSEIFECKLINLDEVDDYKYNKIIVESGFEYSKALGLDNYFIESLTEQFFDDVAYSLTNKIGFSAVRIGDGEGRVLGYPDLISDQELLQQVFYYQFGQLSVKEMTKIIHRESLQSQILSLKNILKNSIESADYVGLPVPQYFKDKDKKITNGLKGYSMGLFIGGSYAYRQINSGKIFGTNFFHLLAKDLNYFSKIFNGKPSGVILINCHNLMNPLISKFNLQCPIEAIITPPHFTWSEVKSQGQFPYLYRKIINLIIDMGNLEGKLFLVGAGIMGKHYCHVIKSLGGVAVDIGSVFDAWAKKGLPYAVNNPRIEHLQP